MKKEPNEVHEPTYAAKQRHWRNGLWLARCTKMSMKLVTFNRCKMVDRKTIRQSTKCTIIRRSTAMVAWQKRQ